jgi:hypothetical protein
MNNRTQSLDLREKLVILNILHQGGLLANSLATRTHAIYYIKLPWVQVNYSLLMSQHSTLVTHERSTIWTA